MMEEPGLGQVLVLIGMEMSRGLDDRYTSASFLMWAENRCPLNLQDADRKQEMLRGRLAGCTEL